MPTMLVALLAAYAALTSPQSLETARPKASSKRLPPPRATRHLSAVHARLWEDPLEAAARGDDPGSHNCDIQRLFKNILKELEVTDLKGNVAKRSEQSETKKPKAGKLKTLLCMPVLVSGGPYADDKEQRMRIRYAVLAGLNRCGYSLNYPQRMTSVWLDVCSYRVSGEYRNVRLNVPVKLYAKDTKIKIEDNAKPEFDYVLVCWINESQLGNRPLGVIAQIADGLFGEVPNADRKTQISVSIFGPTSSDGLIDMASEDHDWEKWYEDKRLVRSETIGSICLPLLGFMRLPLLWNFPQPGIANDFSRYRESTLYSPRATVDRMSLDDGDAGVTALKNFSERDPAKDSGVKLIRTIGTDRVLAEALNKELKLRGKWPRLGSGENENDIVVLITERDTLYGRAFPSTFRKIRLGKTHPEHDGDGIEVFKYLRGIDGRVPDQDSTEKSADKAKSYNSDKGRDERNDSSLSPRPAGQSQLDYLRRLERQLKHLEADSMKDGGGIKAIGVVGTDLYDKLLILRSLRPLFPRASFFTTDLDAGFAHKAEYDSTRNLIVASHFGLELNHELQGDVPSFRDSYQTAYFFSCILALNRGMLNQIVQQYQPAGENSDFLRDPWGTEPEKAIAYLNPLVFEIARDGPYQLTQTETETEPLPAFYAKIHSHSWRDEYMWLSTNWLRLLGAISGAVVVIAYTTTLFHRKSGFLRFKVAKVAKVAKGDPGRKFNWMDGWILFASVVAACIVGLIVFDHGRLNGEPFEFNGISVWPSTLIRFLALLSALWLLITGINNLNENARELREWYFDDNSTRENAPSGKVKSRARDELERRQTIWKSLQPWHRKIRPTTLPNKAESLTEWYLGSVQTGRFPMRVLIPAVAYFGFGLALFQMLGRASVPARGNVSGNFTQIFLYLAVIVMIVLVFFVLDAIQLCRRFIRELANTRRKWPKRSRRKLREKRGKSYPDELACELLTMQVIGHRTQAVGNLIVGPFVVVLLLLVSRHPVFDNWNYPIPLLIVTSIILLAAAWSAFALRNTADHARQDVLKRLQEGLAEARGSQVSADERTVKVQHFEQAIAETRNLEQGTFRHYSQDPVLKALAIPFGGYGGVILLEQLLGGM